MPDYQEMYLHLMRETEEAIHILVKAQQDCEELYLRESAEIPEIRIKNNTGSRSVSLLPVLCFVWSKLDNIRNITLQHIAEVIQRIQGDTAVLPQRVQCPRADPILLNQSVLGYVFPLQGLPQWLKCNHTHTYLAFSISENAGLE